MINPWSRRPFYLIFFVTARCAAACAYCLNRQRPAGRDPGRELSLPEIERLARGLRPLPVLSLTGGEPFLRDDVGAIAECFVRTAGSRYLTLHTNGCDPDRFVRDLDRILALPPVRLLEVCLSLDAPDDEHDRIRAARGLFAGTAACARAIADRQRREPRLGGYVSVVITPRSLPHLEKLRQLVTGDWKLPISFGLERHQGMPRADCRAAYGRLARAALRDFPAPRGSLRRAKQLLELVAIDEIERRLNGARRAIPCIAGSNLLVLYADGTLAPCEHRADTFGNVREMIDHPLGLLATATGRALVAEIRQRSCVCGWENPLPFSLLRSPRRLPGLLRAAWSVWRQPRA